MVKAMRNFLIISVFLFLWSCTACNENSPNHDSDDLPDSHDSDSAFDDNSDDSSDEVLTKSDEKTDYDATDKDISNQDEDVNDADSDSDSLCPDLKIRENVKKAGFPFKRNDGSVHFCREGCDTPTENDPDCVKNLWKWINWGVLNTTDIGECYPWPCEMMGLHAETPQNSTIKAHECDRRAVPPKWFMSGGTIPDLHISDGKVGMFTVSDFSMEFMSVRVMEYNVKKDLYYSVGYAYGMSYYNHNRFIFMTSDSEWTDEDYKSYIISAEGSGTNYKYEVIYTDENFKPKLNRPSFIGKKWVMIQIGHRDSGDPSEILYSEVDKWDWHRLHYGRIYDGNIVGDRITFHDSELRAVVCDLSKYPKSLDECLILNRGDEKIGNPKLDRNNPDRLMYSANGQNYFTFVDLSGETPKYEDHIFTVTEETVYSIRPDQFFDDYLLYGEQFYYNGQSKDGKACFYKLSEEKVFCPREPGNGYDYDQGFHSYSSPYLLWKTPAGPLSYVRDRKCYCEKEGSEYCPFPEYR